MITNFETYCKDRDGLFKQLAEVGIFYDSNLVAIVDPQTFNVLGVASYRTKEQAAEEGYQHLLKILLEKKTIPGVRTAKFLSGHEDAVRRVRAAMGWDNYGQKAYELSQACEAYLAEHSLPQFPEVSVLLADNKIISDRPGPATGHE